MTIYLPKLHLRDPYVVPMPDRGEYLLYGSPSYREGPKGLDVFTSRDLVAWEGPFEIFAPPPDFWADRDFGWATEMHPWRDGYYLFTTFKSGTVRRGTQILRADSPMGPFVPLTDGPVTPSEWECLDGTLFVDDTGDPWIVFCHEWEQTLDGEMSAMRLTHDLTRAAGEPHLLFRASELPWGRDFPSPGARVTDGPCLYRTAAGRLLMIWSSFGEKGYGVAVARSQSDTLLGPWEQDPEPLYGDDGGHGSLFRTFEGQLMLSLHRPNSRSLERPLFVPVDLD